MSRVASLALAGFFVAGLMAPALAQSPEQRGLEIAREAERRDSGFRDSQARMTMRLRNRQGDESTRYVRVKTLEVSGDGDKSLSIFDEPADVKGTAFLTFSHAAKADDQWLYLPALKRVKRISSRNKSGPFMGSEFAYEDISSQEVDKYSYRYLRDEAVEGRNCFVLERIPTYAGSGYTRQVVWMDQERYQALKVEYYDRRNALLKTLQLSDYRLYLDRYWRSHQMLMENHLTGKSTLLNWSEFEFQTGLADKDFTRNSLKRAR